MKKYFLTFILVLFCACSNNVNVEKHNKCFSVDYLNDDLKNELKCEEKRNNDVNNLVVVIELTNISNKELKLKLSHDWFSDNGLHIDNLGLAKKELIIPAKETKYIKLGAPANAHNYKVKINKFN